MPTFGVVERQQLGLFRPTNCLRTPMQSSAQPLEPLMKFVRRSILVFALALTVARCADQPTAVKAPAGPQFLRWADAPQFSARITPRARRSGAMSLTPPLSLDQYVVSFWAVRGESRSVQINYSSSIDNQLHPFLVLTTTDPQFVPGVGELAVGDSVLVTVIVDTTKIGVSLEPHGLQFGESAQMKISYCGPAACLNGGCASYRLSANNEVHLSWRSQCSN